MNTQPKISEYDQQAIDFLESTGTTLEIDFEYTGKYFPGETEKRDIYQFTLKNSKGEYSSTFGDSIHNTERRAFVKNFNRHTGFDVRKGRALGLVSMNGHSIPAHLTKKWAHHKPSAYSILSCLDKYDVGSFKDFCSNFGYNEQPLSEYPNVMKTYEAVTEQYRALSRMFTPEQMEQLAEIS